MWIVEKRVPRKRATAYDGGTTTFDWVLHPDFGVFATRNEAKCAYIVSFDPSLKGQAEEHLLRHWSAMARNLQYARVRKL